MSNAPRTKRSVPSHDISEVRWVDETESISKSTNQPKHGPTSSAPFILETGKTRPVAAQSRQLIHSYASRHRPKKGKGKVKKPNAEVSGQELTWRVDVRDEPKSKTFVRASPRPLKHNVVPPMSIRLDPFHTLEVPSNQETDLVLRHWIVVVEQAGRETLSPEYWSFVATSPALLFATMSISALDIHNKELQTFGQPSYSFLRFKYEAIKEINKNMQKTSEQLKDTTVCAVAVLALTDLVMGVLDSFEKHAAGLGVMIQQRGGFNTLEGQTKQMVMWLVFMANNLQKPLPFYTVSNIPTSEKINALENSKTYIREYLSDILPIILDHSLVSVYAGLLALTHILDQPDFIASDGSFDEKAVHLTSLSLALVEKIESMQDFRGRDILLAFALAALIYQYVVIHHIYQAPGGVREQCTVRTRNVLRRMDIIQAGKDFPDLMIWILTLAAVEQNVPNDNFGACLQIGRNLCREMRLEGIEDVTAALQRFAWPMHAKIGDDYTIYWKEIL